MNDHRISRRSFLAAAGIAGAAAALTACGGAASSAAASSVASSAAASSEAAQSVELIVLPSPRPSPPSVRPTRQRTRA